MEAAAYQSLRDLQDDHWWFVGRRAVLSALISRFVELPADALIMEAGCGYGGNLPMLSRFGEVSAFEFDASAREYAARQCDVRVESGFLPNGVGFVGEHFDLVAMFDVLEHIEDDVAALRSLRERPNAGGSIMITVPALPWL